MLQTLSGNMHNILESGKCLTEILTLAPTIVKMRHRITSLLPASTTVAGGVTDGHFRDVVIGAAQAG
jgi:hypothetical protein